MSIAQQLVAGEVEVRLELPENNSAADLSSDLINLPWGILRAVHRATRLDGIPARARNVLAALARTVDASNPYGHIFARRELLTERAMQSERTFYRSLDDLESAGLIERPPQRRYVQAGLFGRAYLHLTERAALVLGLVEAPALSAETEAADKSAEAARAPAEALGQRSANVADGGIYKDLIPTSLQKRQPGQLPADLQRLRPLGFREFLIFRLMREAREQGKRLSDVVEATWEHLRQAKRPICYLRALLRSTADFGFQIRRRDAERDAAQAAIDEQHLAETLVAQSAGKTFIDTSGQHKLVIDGDATSLSVYHAEEGVARRDAGQWQIRFAKALRDGQLRIATDVDLEAFAQARRLASAPAAQTSAEVPRVTTGTGTRHLALLKTALRAARSH